MHLGPRARALALLACAISVPAWADPTNPVSLLQQNGDGTSLATGAVTAEGREVVLTASSSSSSCYYSPYHLELEVRPSTAGFTGVPTHYSPVLVKSTCAQQQ